MILDVSGSPGTSVYAEIFAFIRHLPGEDHE